MHKVIIIGSGPAGLTAAVYAARAELEPLVLMGPQPGGQLMWTADVENFPGFPKGINGPELMQNMIKQAEGFGAKLVYQEAEEVDFSKPPYTVKTASDKYQGQAVIVATGASAKWLGLESEEKLKGKGVSACATCDGAFFKDKKVFVVGGGDAALEEANFLTKFAISVTVLIRGDQLRASKIMQERAKNNPKVEIISNTEVVEVLGDEKMTGLKIINNQTKETSEVEGDGLFVAIGHKPNTDIFKGQLKFGEKDYLSNEDCCTAETSKPGIFIAGDVFDYKYRQAITAAGYGCMAAIDAERYLAHHV